MSTALLVHFDGTSGQTTFTDDAGHTLTATSATVNTATPKFGTGCGDFTAGAGAARIDTGNAVDFNLGNRQFTVEAWAYFTSAPISSNIYGILTQFGGSGNLGWFLGQVQGSLAFYYSTSGTDNPSVGVAYTPALNTWIHIAADRDASNVIRVYANGVVMASATVSASIYASTQTCVIGNDHNNNRAFPGRLDEARVTSGVAKYGGAFTPPTAPFTLDPNTAVVEVTQVGIEEWIAASPTAQVTQVGIEEWARISVRLLLLRQNRSIILHPDDDLDLDVPVWYPSSHRRVLPRPPTGLKTRPYFAISSA